MHAFYTRAGRAFTQERSPIPLSPEQFAKPHDYDHSHADVSSGWLRASVFGAMDGLVSNLGLIAGIAAAGAAPAIVIVTGLSGLIAGSISMALGEFTSVRTANEQLDAETRIEHEAHARNPHGEKAELAALFNEMGMTEVTAQKAAAQVHENRDRAVKLHLSQELGFDPEDKPSPWVAAISSLSAFSAGAIIPLLPFLLGFGSILWGLVFGGAGLLLAGAVAALLTKRNPLSGATRQLVFGSCAVVVTYTIGTLLGVAGV